MDEQTRTSFYSAASACLEALARVEKELDWAHRAAYKILLGPDPALASILRSEIPTKLRKTLEFQRLLDFATETPSLRQIFVGESHWDPEDAAARRMLRTYMGLLLARAICLIGVAEKAKQGQMLENFANFLSLEGVFREVRLPLIHLKLEKETFDLGEFGILQKIQEPHDEEVPQEILQGIVSHPHCILTFTIHTNRFLDAEYFPLGDVLRSRIGLLRIAVDPLISYNHFYVQHIRPWETPLHDYNFHSRFWAQPTSAGKLAVRTFTGAHAKAICSVYPAFIQMNQDSITPWRLALNRLDDAVFKLECGSPDAILDLVIGLESLFVEPESSHESTHKVATRLARFLHSTESERIKIFREAKELYKLRSKLAHGRGWSLDEKGVAKVESAAALLGRALHKMLQEKRTELDLLALDLA